MGIYACEDVCVNINNTKSQKHTKQRKDKIMIRRNLLKATLLTTVIATLLVSSACGKNNNNIASNIETTQSMQTTEVSKETEKSTDNNTNTETTAETNAENVENTEVVVSENNNTEQEIIVADNNNISESNDGNSYVEDNNNNNNNEVIANDTPNVDVVDNTPAPAPADTTPVIDNTPVINEDNNTSVDNNIANNNTNADNSSTNTSTGNNNGYDFPTVDGPNGPMYAYNGDKYIVGQDVNQGPNVECPYTMKQVTTRYFAKDSVNFSNCEGYYYISVDGDFGDEIPLDENPFNAYMYQVGHRQCVGSRVGIFSCGDVWFCAFDD